ncbi:MAG: hypothetical protein IIB03_09605 [Acidobacteria bacterium]|nr:hypothetical protein [Acidobacteriota bacterium]
MALFLAGHEKIAVDDGAMREWSGKPEMPGVAGEGPFVGRLVIAAPSALRDEN